MIFRKAMTEDLEKLREVFGGIIEDMYAQGIDIWDDYYPCGLFPGDIARGELYLLEDGEDVLAAFALTESNKGEKAVIWQEPEAKALYFDRFGVNHRYKRQGIGSSAVEYAAQTAKNAGAKYLRLFVVDVNTPASALYEKNGFLRAGGYFDEYIDEDLTLREFGYEKKLL